MVHMAYRVCNMKINEAYRVEGVQGWKQGVIVPLIFCSTIPIHPLHIPGFRACATGSSL